MSNKVDLGLSFKFQLTEKSMSDVSVDLNSNFDKKTIIREFSDFTNIKVYGI